MTIDVIVILFIIVQMQLISKAILFSLNVFLDYLLRLINSLKAIVI